jgi:hypothetical protein
MITNNALTTTATQVETILADHSVTYTTTDNRDKEEEGDYRITVGDVTAYLTTSDAGEVWATTDENPADAYDGPAVADEIALHLMNYATEIPAAVKVISAVAEETAGDCAAAYWEGYWTVEDSHTTVEVDTDGDWTVAQSDVDGIEWSDYKGRDVAAVFQAGAMAYGQPLDAIATVIMGGDYEMADWWSIVEDLTDLRSTDDDAGTRVYTHWGSSHPGVLVAEEHDGTESRWIITDLDTMATSVEHGAQDAAANVIYTLA